MDRTVEQELAGVIGQLAQHPVEVTTRRQTRLDGKAIRSSRVANEGEAEQPDQRWMFDQEGVQTAHDALLLMELDEIGGYEDGAWGWAEPGQGRSVERSGK